MARKRDDFDFGDGGGGEGGGASAPAPGEDAPLRLADDEFERPLSALSAADSARAGVPDPGGERAEGGDFAGGAGAESSGLRRTDDEENVYVLLDDKPEPPSKPAWTAPAAPALPPLDPDAELGDEAPGARHGEGRPGASALEAPLMDAAGGIGRPLPGLDQEGGAAEVEERGAADASEPRVATSPEEEPEFLYPKKTSDRVEAAREEPRRPRRAPQVLFLCVLAVLVGGFATVAVRALLKRSEGTAVEPPPAPAWPAVPPGKPAGPAGDPAPGVREPRDPVAFKARRALAWGLPAGALPEHREGGETR